MRQFMPGIFWLLAGLISVVPPAFAQQKLITLSNSVTTASQCMIFSGDGAAAYPSLFNWGQGTAFCGFAGGKPALLANKQAVWKIVALDTNFPGDRYIIKNASDGNEKCLGFGGSGQAAYPSRLDWGAHNEFCGMPGGKAALLANQQAVWHLVVAYGPPTGFLLKNNSSGSEQCLSFASGNSAPPTRAFCPPVIPNQGVPPAFLFQFTYLD